MQKSTRRQEDYSFDQPIRVLHLLRPSAGGMRAHLLTLLGFLDQRRFHVTLAASEQLLESLPERARLAADLLPLQLAESGGPLGLVYNTVQLSSVLMREPYDILHAHGVRATLASSMGGGFAKVQVCTHHKNLSGFVNPAIRPLIFYAFNTQKYCIAPSEALRLDLLKLGIRRNRTVVIPHGVSIERPGKEATDKALQTLGIPRQARILLLPAHLLDRKTPRFLATCLTGILEKHSDVWLLVAGDVPLVRYQNRLKPLAGRDRVVITGRVDDLTILLAASQALVVPSPGIDIPLTALEAMYLGCPVVAMQGGELSQILLDGVNGLLVNPTSPEDLVKKLEALLQIVEFRARLSVNACQSVRDGFAPEVMARKLEALYMETLNDRQQGAASVGI